MNIESSVKTYCFWNGFVHNLHPKNWSRVWTHSLYFPSNRSMSVVLLALSPYHALSIFSPHSNVSPRPDMCQDPRKNRDWGSSGSRIRNLNESWIPDWHFVEGSSGYWILFTQLLRDPVDLGSCLRKMLLGSEDPSSCSEKINWLRWALDHFKRKVYDGRCWSLELPVTFSIAWNDKGNIQSLVNPRP